MTDASSGQNDDNHLTEDASVGKEKLVVDDRYIMEDAGQSLLCSCAS